MKNYKDYLDYYGNLSFKNFVFNEIDALLFAMLSYVQFNGIVPEKKNESISLKKACELFLKKHSKKEKNQDWMFEITYPIVENIQNCNRYKNTRLYNFISIVNENCQFGAMTIRDSSFTYISFEGTDSSIIGWKEDLELFYKYPIPSQTLAKEYLENTLNLFDRNVYIGGHSKGGNLAMYATMNCKKAIMNKVKHVYNFDGPGFFKEVIESSSYEELSKKLTTILPEESVVGLSLYQKDYKVVPSSNFAIMQHDATSWEIFGSYFVKGKLSRKSEKLQKNLIEYIETMNMEERKRFVETSFQVFEKTKITNVMQLKDLKISTLLTFMKEIKNIPSETKRNFVAIMRLLITTMRN